MRRRKELKWIRKNIIWKKKKNNLKEIENKMEGKREKKKLRLKFLLSMSWDHFSPTRRTNVYHSVYTFLFYFPSFLFSSFFLIEKVDLHSSSLSHTFSFTNSSQFFHFLSFILVLFFIYFFFRTCTLYLRCYISFIQFYKLFNVLLKKKKNKEKGNFFFSHRFNKDVLNMLLFLQILFILKYCIHFFFLH